MTTVNFTKPVTSDLRADVLAYIRDYMAGQSKLFSGDTLVSPPVGLIRLGTNKLESWNGSGFVDYDLASQYFSTITSQADGFFRWSGTGVGGVQVRVGWDGIAMRPNTSTGGWAYGVIAEKQSDGLRMAGAGWYGSNQTINGFFVGIDADWWSNWKLKITTTEAIFANHLGIGATVPESNWAAGRNVLKLHATAALWADSVAGVFSNNGLWDGTNWKYITTAPITDYYQYNGEHVWRSAVSGTAGTNATMNAHMILDVNGNLRINATSNQARRVLDAGGETGGNYVRFPLRCMIGSSNNEYPAIGYNWRAHATGTWTYDANDYASRMVFQSGGFDFQTAPTGAAAGNTITWTTAVSITNGGNVNVGSSSSGRVNLVPGGVSNPGYIEFRSPDGTRRGYIGWASSSRLMLAGENGWSYYCDSMFDVAGVVTLKPSGSWTTSGWGKSLALPQSYVVQWLKGGYSYSWGMGLSGNTFYFTYSTADDGSAAPSYWLQVVGGTGAATFLGNTSAPIVYATSYAYSYGNVYAQGDVIAYYSDERLKKRLGNIVGALESVLSLDGFRYRLNKKGRKVMNRPDDRAVQLAVSAQQVKRVAPEAVTLAPFDMAEDGTSKSGENYLTVKYERLIPLLIEAIKELNDKVDRL